MLPSGQTQAPVVEAWRWRALIRCRFRAREDCSQPRVAAQELKVKVSEGHEGIMCVAEGSRSSSEAAAVGEECKRR